MNISILGFVLGLLLLAIPFYIIYYFKLRVMRRLLLSMARMFVAVAIVAVIVYGGLKLNSIVYDIITFIVLSLASSILALGKARLNVTKLLLPVGVGSIVAVAFVGFYFALLVCGEKNPFLPHIFVPLFGVIALGMSGVNAKALQTYYVGLLHHGQLYNYLIGNGGTHREAIHYFVRRGLQSSVVSVAKQMSVLVVVTSPVTMLAMVMSGSDVFTAFAFQVLFYIGVLSASLIALLIALLIGRKYSFDEYERLKPVFKTSKEKVSTVNEDGLIGKEENVDNASVSEPYQASDSSSNPEEPLHTDFESQPQAE